MSHCPSCLQLLPTLAIECPHCHCDLLPPQEEKLSSAWEYSGVADLFLIIATLIASLQSIVCGIGSLYMFVLIPFGSGRLSDRFTVAFLWLLCFCVSVAMAITFQRVSNLSHDRK